MLRNCGELIIESSSTTDNIVDLIKDYEVSLALNDIPDPFSVNKLGIKCSAECILNINGRDFTVDKDDTIEFGYDTIEITDVTPKTEGAKLIVRYMYNNYTMI